MTLLESPRLRELRLYDLLKSQPTTILQALQQHTFGRKFVIKVQQTLLLMPVAYPRHIQQPYQLVFAAPSMKVMIHNNNSLVLPPIEWYKHHRTLREDANEGSAFSL